MAKKKKSTLNSILGIASDLTEALNIIPDAEGVYNISKDVAINSKNSLEISAKAKKIKDLIIEIGNRAYEKQIKFDDKNIKAELDCIKELEEKIRELKKSIK